MPYSVTILRAIWVACSRSFEAPVVMSPNTSCSDALPPRAAAIMSASSDRV